jgi:outer membrane lipoprotein-sorting protein
MNRRLLHLIALPIFAVAPLLAQGLNADQIIAKNVEAMGGLAKLKAIKSIRLSGKASGGPMEVPFVMELKRPGSFYQDVTVQNMHLVQAFDGKTGWTINPFAGYGGKKDPELMDADELKSAQDQSDIDGPLVDYKEKGHKVEYLGKEDLEGSPVHKLQVTLKSGNVKSIFLDADSFLAVKQASKRVIRGTEVETETILGDYKEVGGVMMPHSMEMGAKGRPEKQKLTIEKVEINPSLDDAKFKMPEKKAEPAPEKKSDPAIEKKAEPAKPAVPEKKG